MIAKKLRILALASAAVLATAGTAAALDGVVASIKPVHSLVSAVMEGVGEPALIVRGAGSEHVHSLRPSDAQALQDARLVFWIGPDMEVFLTGPIGTLAGGAKAVALAETPGLTLLDYREGGPFEAHDHGDHHSHGHDDDDHGGADHAHGHDDHGHGHDRDGEDRAHGHEDHRHGHAHGHDDDRNGEDHTHEHDDHGSEDHAHNHGDHGHRHDDRGHAHGRHDLHFWLDPVNAGLLLAEIERTLSEADPENAGRYRANAEAYSARLDALVAEVEAAVAPLRDRPVIVFHDAYQYFENRFGINVVGSITVSPEAMPGAQRLSEIRARVEETGAACIFAEPQFEPRLVTMVAEETGARAGVLDPLGAEIEDGPELYFELIRNLATSLTTCLGEEG